MYTTRRLRDFEVSMRYLGKSGIKTSLKQKIIETIDTLASGQKLPDSYKDHKLSGEFFGYRECHIKSNLLLIYKIERDNLVLILADIGSHPQLFG